MPSPCFLRNGGSRQPNAPAYLVRFQGVGRWLLLLRHVSGIRFAWPAQGPRDSTSQRDPEVFFWPRGFLKTWGAKAKKPTVLKISKTFKTLLKPYYKSIQTYSNPFNPGRPSPGEGELGSRMFWGAAAVFCELVAHRNHLVWGRERHQTMNI